MVAFSGSSRSFIDSTSFFFVSGTDVLFRPVRRLPVRNQQRQAGSGRSSSGSVPSNGLEIEDEGHLNDFVVIFVFV